MEVRGMLVLLGFDARAVPSGAPGSACSLSADDRSTGNCGPRFARQVPRSARARAAATVGAVAPPFTG